MAVALARAGASGWGMGELLKRFLLDLIQNSSAL
jgi:hypothetical protein